MQIVVEGKIVLRLIKSRMNLLCGDLFACGVVKNTYVVKGNTNIGLSHCAVTTSVLNKSKTKTETKLEVSRRKSKPGNCGN